MFDSNHAVLKAVTHNAVRIVAGFLFSLHGVQKLFGALGASAPVDSLMSRPGIAGILEFFGGILIAIGLFTRPVAFLVAGEMAVAYFVAHVPRGFWPIMNGGELAALYAFLWLFFFAHGPGAYSLDAWLARRKGGESAG